MSKKFSDPISEKNLKQGIVECIKNSKTLSNESLLLLKNSKENSVSLGLFSFAIEEFGKAVILNNHLQNSDYNIPTNIFGGFGSHDIKFNAAKEYLPQKCWEHFEERRVTKLSTDTEQEIVRDKEKGETFFEETTATTGTYRTDKITINFQTRMNFFFVNWDDITKSWKTRPSEISEIALEKSISLFIDELNKFSNLDF